MINENNQVYGIITENQLTNYLTSYKLGLDHPIARAVIKDFKQVKTSDSIKYLSKGFTRHTFILVTDENNKHYISENKDMLNAFLNKN